MPSNITFTPISVSGGRWSSGDQDGNNAPTVANAISNQSATEDSAFSFQFASNTFADADGDTLTYSATLSNGSALPAWLTFTPATRTFSGTPENVDIGVITVRVTASDGALSVYDDFTLTVASASSTLIGRADWSLHSLTPTSILTGTSWSTWTTVGATQSVVDNAVQMNYPNSVTNEGTSGNVAFYVTDNAIEIDDVWITFEAKMPNLKGGLKFLKLFGRNNGGYANTTLAADYAGYEIGGFPYIGFGDGSGTTNDTQNLIWTKNQTQNAIGSRNSGATVVTPQSNWFTGSDWGTTWHTFKFRMKFNSGTTAETETPDGVYYLEIDNNIYVNATGIFNRHYSNSRFFDNIGFGGWSQSINFAFDVHFRNIKIATGGWPA